jgi:glycerol-3-phosphate dehydrogenase
MFTFVQMLNFSAHSRLQLLEKAASREVDLIVIGGGITGAGIALDAALRGLTVVLVEKSDFASGTSSRSTKLIHGGLRYLKQLDFKLVREVGKERAIAFANAPHLVMPEPMLLPVLKNGSLGKFSTAVGLWLYETLAGVKHSERRKMLTKKSTSVQEPLLDESILLGGALYSEYRTDDARLTIELLKSAADAGAILVNYCEAFEFITQHGRLSGICVREQFSGKQFQLKSLITVNAAGPWVDAIRRKDAPINGKRLHLTKGVHIVIPRSRLPIKQAVYFDTDDGRMIFAIPRGETTYIGTTDTNYSGSLEHPSVSREDADYLLHAVNRLFPLQKLTVSDVISSWSGLRPLIHSDGKDPSELSRKDELFESQSGLISIAGGKLTGYRKMAERVVDRVVRQLKSDLVDREIKSCRTKNYALGGGNFTDREAIFTYIERQAGEAMQIGATYADISKLVWKYGRNTEKIIDYAYSNWHTTKNKTTLLQFAEMWYSIEFEMAVLPSDFWIRRTAALYFERPGLYESFEQLYPDFSNLEGFKEAQSKEFAYAFLKELDEAVQFTV